MKRQKEEQPVQTLLHNDAVEMNILGTIIGRGTAVMEYVARQGVTDLMFYQPQNRNVYRLLEAMLTAGKDINLTTATIAYLETEDGKADPQYPFILDSNCMEAELDTSVAKLKDLHQRRCLWEICTKHMDVGTDKTIGVDDTKTGIIEDIKALDDNPNSNISTISDALHMLYDRMAENADGEGKRGIPTGFNGIDRHGYFQHGDLVVIAAESSQGKTSFAMDIATNVAKQGIPVAVYSMEMTQEQIAARMMSADTKINSNRLMNERMTEEEMQKTDKSFGKLEALPMYFDDSSTVSVEKIYQSIRMTNRRNGVKLVVVDYLQILSTNQKVLNQESFYGEVARKLKNIAKELGVCVILLSQLSRCNDTTEPSLRRIRGSGQINEAADWTFTIYRPETYGKVYTGDWAGTPTQGTALIKCEKGRNVGTFAFICGFDAACTHFTNEWIHPACQPPSKNTGQTHPVIPVQDECPF